MIPVPVPLSAQTVREILNSVNVILQRKKKHAEEEKKRADIALEALLNAITSTRQYLALVRDHPEKQTPEKQDKITEKWSDVAIKLKEYDPDLANACFAKAEYWADREGWDAAGKSPYLIDLDRISLLGRKALIGQE